MYKLADQLVCLSRVQERLIHQLARSIFHIKGGAGGLREVRLWLDIGPAVTYRVGLRSRRADSHAMPRRCWHTTSLPQSARIASGFSPNRLPHCLRGSESSEGERCDLISASGLLT
jgi:hypothetical protein